MYEHKRLVFVLAIEYDEDDEDKDVNDKTELKIK